MNSESKVFGIGFQKTGTSSLGDALTMLGYSVCRMNYADRVEREIGEPLTSESLKIDRFQDLLMPIATEWAESHNGLQDVPWFLVYKEMDAAYPGSKFILTTREPEAWIRSMRSYDRTYTKPRAQIILEWIFGVGSPTQNEDHYKEVYRNHLEEVRSWFKERPNDFLELAMEGEDKMRTLCRFLGKPQPRNRFGLFADYPHANVGERNHLLNLKSDLLASLGFGGH